MLPYVQNPKMAVYWTKIQNGNFLAKNQRMAIFGQNWLVLNFEKL